jgi:two-component system KDP operon response regulator KdpE
MNNHAPSVLLVDDEAQIRRFLRAGFEMDGFNVQDAENGSEGIKNATMRPPDLIILDLALPDVDGSEVLARLRSWSNVPVIVLSVRSNEDEKVKLLQLGADDYVVKPFGMAELLARSRAAIRRHTRNQSGDPVVSLGRLSVDLANRSVFVDGERLSLTRKEFRLLQILAQHAGNVVTHSQLLNEIWGTGHDQDSHYLRIFVRKLRQKIEVDPTKPKLLLTELGVGYRLSTDESVKTTQH